MRPRDTMIITEASLPRPDGGAPFALVSDDGTIFWELTSLLRWAGGSDIEAMSFARPVLVDRGATFTERPVRHYRAATGEPAA
jgi:hypothetical protein